MPVGRVGVEGYTRKSSTGKIVHVSRYTQKRSLAEELNRLGRAPIAASQGRFAGDRTAPMSPSSDRSSLKAQQKRVAALRAQVARARADASPDIAEGVPNTRKALKDSVAGRRAAAQKKSEREKALRNAEKLVNTRGADPKALRDAQDALNKAVNSQKARQEAAAKRVEARAAAEKKRIEDEKAAAKAAEEAQKAEVEAAKAAREAFFRDFVHPLAILDDDPASYSFVHDPDPTKEGNYTVGQGPDGRFLDLFPVTEKPNVPEGWDSGVVFFDQPLRVAENTEKGNWKAALEEWGKGAHGEELSQKLRDLGFDGVLAYDDKGDVVDSVDLGMFKPRNESFLTEPEKFSVSEYKAEAGADSLYVDLNHFLRYGEPHPDSYSNRGKANLLDHAKKLDEAIKKNSLGTPKTLYRGISNTSWMPEGKLAPGTVLVDKGFVSTTPDKGLADYFGDTLLEIQTPSGMSGLDITDFGDGYSENEPEILLPRNLSMRVVSDGIDENGKRLIRVKVAPPGSTIEPLSGPERVAVKNYTGRDYKSINSYLRKGYPDGGMSAEDLATHVDDIDGALSKSPLLEDKTLYRGVDFAAMGLGFDNPKRDLPLTPGTIIRDKGFLSTTEDEAKSRDFGSIKLEISTPKGYHALDIEANDLHQPVHKGEREFLLPRDTQLEVVSDTGGISLDRVIKLRVVPNNEGASNGNQEGQAGSNTGPGGTSGSGNGIQGQLVSDRSPAADQFWVPGQNGVGEGSGGGNSAQGPEQAPEDGVRVVEAQPFIDAPHPTLAQQEAATDYAGSGYSTLNEDLRSGAPLDKWSKKIQEGLDSMFEKSSLNQDTTVYRRAKFDFGDVGSVFVDKGYISTEHALDFADVEKAPRYSMNGKDLPLGGNTQLEIRVPAGYPAIDINQASGFDGGENEILLPRGTAFKVVSKERVEGTTHFGYTKAVLEVVPPGTTSEPDLTPAEKERQQVRENLSPKQLEDAFDPFLTPGTIPLNSKTGKMVSAIYGGDFNGLRPVVEHVSMDSGDTGNFLKVSGHVYDADGREAASWERHFEYDALDDAYTVHHQSLVVDKNFRGQGFSTAWNRSAEDAYRKMGVSKVTLNAVSVGGYAWARAGYDWRRRDDASLDFIREESATEILDVLDGIEMRFNAAVGNGAYSGNAKQEKAVRAEIDQFRARVQDFSDNPNGTWEDLPTPFDLSQIGYTDGATSWPGKSGMIGTNWSGEKRLYDVAPNPVPPVFESSPEMTPARVVPLQETPQAAPPAGTPTVTPERVTEAFSAPTDAFRNDVGTDIYGGKTGNLATRVSRSSKHSYPTHEQVRWSGIIADSNGHMVGEFERSLNREKVSGVLSVKHDSLMLNPEVQGQGFASEWNSKAEQHYRDMGVAFIDVSATGVGGYAWARAGYDWSDESNNSLLPEGTARSNSFSALGMLGVAKSYLKTDKFAKDAGFANDAERKDFIDKTEAQITKYEQAFSDYAFGGGDFTALPTPYDISQIGFRDGAEIWPGKVGMLQSHWEGRKKLNAPFEQQQADYVAQGIDQSVTDISNEFNPTEKQLELPFSRQEFIDSLSTTNSPENIDRAQAMFGYSNEDYSVGIDSAGYSDGLNGYIVSGSVKDREGNTVGSFAREFHTDPETGALSVVHKAFALDDVAQGQGLATAINAQAEKAYRALGVDKISLTAMWTGGYAWARAGYDWDSSIPDDKLYYTMDDILKRVQDAAYASQFNQSLDMGPDFIQILKKQLSALRLVLEAFHAGEIDRNAPNFPTPYDISQVGYRPGYSSWPGKDGLIGSTWSGEKRL